jgi:hypothetical protein
MKSGRFELLWILFGLNLVNNIFKFKLLSRKKLTLALFHFAFLMILIGAAITRFVSYEGLMHIRESASSDHILSSDDYFYASINGQESIKHVDFSEITPRQFSKSFKINSKRLKIKTTGFIKDAEKKAIPSDSGNPVIGSIRLGGYSLFTSCLTS